MNTTLSPPPATQEPSQRAERQAPPPRDEGVTVAQRRRLLGIGLFLLVVGIAHFSLIPGFVLGGRRFGWHDTLWLLGNNAILTWLIVSPLLALAVLYDLRASLRPLGLPVGPQNWMRRAVKGAMTSLVVLALMWPGLEPSPAVFLPLALAGTLVLGAWILRRFYRTGPLAQIETATVAKHRSLLGRCAVRVSQSVATMVAVLVVMLGSWLVVPVSTPPIADAQGHQVPGSIAAMQQVKLGGVSQWIVMRGTSAKNPVLLWLAGGPGGSELGWVRKYNADLEKRFVVVNWEQRASGKGFLQLYTHSNSITPQQYVKDGLQLTNYLRHRFHQNKIYVVGHSWGTFLGMWMVQQRPQWFHAYVGVAQMVNGALNDRLWYDITLQRARQAGNGAEVKTLESYGPPVRSWYHDNPITFTRRVADINFINDKYMAQDMEAHGGTDDQGDLSVAVNTPEYRPIDKLFWIAGPTLTFQKVYGQLYPVNLVKQAIHLKVPVYFIEGRWDINAPTTLVQQLYRVLEAPQKHLVWFERSGHNPCYQEPAKFNSFMVNTVLRQTQR